MKRSRADKICVAFRCSLYINPKTVQTVSMNIRQFVPKMIFILLIGLWVAVFLYPLLHELSHVLFTILFGGQIRSVSFWPTPSVLCELQSHDRLQVTLIGLSGIICPVLISLLPSPRCFAAWYTRFHLLLVNAFGTLSYLFFAICFLAGHPLQNNDITTILTHAPASFPFIVPLLFVCFVFLCIAIRRSAPVSTILNFFNEQNILSVHTQIQDAK